MKNNNQIRMNFALVTGQGLLFQERYFSNAEMIKNNWFELAAVQGSWQVPIMYREDEPHHIVLFDLHSVEIAIAIEQKKIINQDVLEAYYGAINSLKQQYAHRPKI